MAQDTHLSREPGTKAETTQTTGFSKTASVALLRGLPDLIRKMDLEGHPSLSLEARMGILDVAVKYVDGDATVRMLADCARETGHPAWKAALFVWINRDKGPETLASELELLFGETVRKRRRGRPKGTLKRTEKEWVCLNAMALLLASRRATTVREAAKCVAPDEETTTREGTIRRLVSRFNEVTESSSPLTVGLLMKLCASVYLAAAGESDVDADKKRLLEELALDFTPEAFELAGMDPVFPPA